MYLKSFLTHSPRNDHEKTMIVKFYVLLVMMVQSGVCSDEDIF